MNNKILVYGLLAFLCLSSVSAYPDTICWTLSGGLLCMNNTAILGGLYLNASFITNPPWALDSALTSEISSRTIADTLLNADITNLYNVKLNVSDQRYNDSVFIKSLNSTLSVAISAVNVSLQSEILNRISNDSFLLQQINAVNVSASTASNYSQFTNVSNLQFFNYSYTVSVLNSTLNTEISDRKANDTALFSANVTTNLRIDSLNSTKGGVGSCPSGQLVQNVTTGGVDCISAGTGTVTSIVAGSGLTGGTISVSGTIALNDSYVLGVCSVFNSSATFSNYYDKTEIDAQQLVQNNSVSNVDGRVTSVNSTLNTEISDRKVNDTALFSSNVTTNLRVDSLNSSKVDKSFTFTSVNSVLLINGVTQSNLSGSNINLSIPQANATQGGSLTASDWNTFNNKFNVSDQRYNDSLRIDSVNSTLQTEISDRKVNDTALFSANVTTNVRVDTLNTTIQGLSTSNTSNSVRINAINTSTNVLKLYAAVQKDPQGFEYTTNTELNTQSILTFTDSTRNFTIAPIGWYTYYIGGVLYNVTAQKSMIVDNTTGIHIIYIDSTGALQETGVLTEVVLCSNAIVAIVYWDAPRGISLSFEDERHSHYMECVIHLELHETIGTHYESGLALTNVTVGASANINQSAQLGITAGQISDEDLHHDILAYNNTAILRTYYSWGVAGNWSFKRDTFPMCYSGACGYTGANGRLGANTGLTTFTQCGNNQFVLTHIFANNAVNTTQDVFAVTGTTCYSTAILATTGAPNEIATIMSTGKFNAEIKPLYSLLLLTTTTATNTPHAAWAAPSTGGQFIDYRNSAVSGVSGVTTSGTVTNVGTDATLTVDGVPSGTITGAGTLGISDVYIQNFNDTLRIDSINSTLQTEITDRKANDTTLFSANVTTNLRVDSINSTVGTHTSQISGIQANITALNTTANIQTLGFITNSQISSAFTNKTAQETITGNWIFNPGTNITFSNNGQTLFYNPVYFFNTVTMTNSSTMTVNGTVRIQNIGGTITGSWTDVGGFANLNTNGYINASTIYENSISLNTKYNESARIDSLNTSKLSITDSVSYYVNRSLWTTIDNYPTGCSAGTAVTTIGDTLTCTAFGTGSSNLTLTDITTSIGNWTLDKPSYVSQTYGNATYYKASNPNNYASGTSNLTLTEVVSSIGNWTLDKSSYATNARVDTVNSTLQTEITNRNANDTAIFSANVTTNLRVDSLNTTKANLANPTFTANITITDRTILTAVAGKFYIWYVNSTYWDCYNGTGTLYNRGNTTLVC